MNSEQLAATADPGAFAVYASGGTYQSRLQRAQVYL